MFLIMAPAVALCATGCFNAFVMARPGFSGVVRDAETDEPLADALVCAFTRYTPLSQIINMGGGNQRYDTVVAVRSDVDGRFRLPGYYRLGLRFGLRRTVRVYQKGYAPVIAYQAAAWRISEEYLEIRGSDWVFRRHDFRLQPGIRYDKFPLPISIASHFAKTAMWRSVDDYMRYRSALLEIYREAQRVSNAEKYSRTWRMYLRSLGRNLHVVDTAN